MFEQEINNMATETLKEGGKNTTKNSSSLRQSQCTNITI